MDSLPKSFVEANLAPCLGNALAVSLRYAFIQEFSMELSQFQQRLESIVPSSDGAHIPLLEELTELSRELVGEPNIAPIVFTYLERHHNQDLGSPGPLVHFLEQSYPVYLNALLASLERRPVWYTLWMTNRILNAKLKPSIRKALFEALVRASQHSLASENERREAFEFMKLHAPTVG
jgi:hypothetical protein